MYKLRPIFPTLDETSVSTCMYKMRKITLHTEAGESNNTETAPTASVDDKEIEELEKRWTMITSRLEQLKSDISAMESSPAPAATSPTEVTPTTPTVADLSVKQDVIMHRVAALMSSLSDLKYRLALMEDPQSVHSTTGIQLQQETLLERIRELNNEIKNISSALNNNNSSYHTDNLQCCSQRTDNFELSKPGEFQDFVIRAHPSRPPYSLQLLKKQLESHQIRVFASTHVHSSSCDVDADLKQFLQSDNQLERRNAHLAFTLIWIKGDNEEPAMMISASSQSVPIHGEANIGRYLARLMPGLGYEEKDAVHAAKLDQLLDLTDPSAALGLNGSKRDRALALQLLEQSLASGGSLTGCTELCWVDAVLYSAAVHAKLNSEKEIGERTRSWFQRCQSSIQVKTCCMPPSVETKCTPSVETKCTPPAESKRSLLENYLTKLGISFRTMDHPAVFTVAAMMEHVSVMPGYHGKNLFVKDKKSSKLFLITTRHDAAVSLSSIAKKIGAKELRFADEEVLVQSLGVTQGSVTPFALMNDTQHQVHLVLDQCLFERSEDFLNFHPLSNDATTSITVEGFKRFLKATGHEPALIKLETK